MDNIAIFHPGELYFQQKSGVVKSVASFAPAMIHEQLTQQQYDFFIRLKMIFVASVDSEGQPWASVITGSPGFIQVLTNTQVNIQAQYIAGDPIYNNLTSGSAVGFLGLEFKSRRRNRMSGLVIASSDKNITIAINKAFGNCPKYIQTRDIKSFEVNTRTVAGKSIQRVEFFNQQIKQLISSADTFFIASSYSDNEHAMHFGADISHRGGQPGFVRIDSDHNLSFDDYSGNNFFMSLGNMRSNPVAGLLFIDFETGDTVQLACSVEIIESTHTSRQIKLTLKYAWYIKSALSIDSEFLEYSPFLNK